MQETNFNLSEKKYDTILRLLKGIKSHVEEQEILNKEILDFNEACRYLKVSESFLYKKTSKGEIKYSKPNGGKLYFKKSDLDEWMLNDELTFKAPKIDDAKAIVNSMINNSKIAKS